MEIAYNLCPLVFLYEPEFQRSAFKGPLFAEFALQVAFVAPVEELSMGAEHFEIWEFIIFLSDVIKFGCSAF